MRFSAPEIVSLTVASIAFAGSIVSGFYAYANRNRELDIKLVEIGIGILRSDPKETGIFAARSWAIDVIENHSRFKFSAQDREALLNRPLVIDPPSEDLPTPRLPPPTPPKRVTPQSAPIPIPPPENSAIEKQ